METKFSREASVVKIKNKKQIIITIINNSHKKSEANAYYVIYFSNELLTLLCSVKKKKKTKKTIESLDHLLSPLHFTLSDTRFTNRKRSPGLL